MTYSQATIDFETYSEAGYIFNKKTQRWESLLGTSDRGIEAVGTAVYATHPTTRILSLAYHLPSFDAVKVWTPDMPLPSDLFNHYGTIEAWNVAFERWIWEEVAVKRYNFPSIHPSLWRCAAAKARAHSLPGKLANAAKVLQTENQKDIEGKRLLNKFSIPRSPTRKDDRLRILPSDDLEDAEKLYQYNRVDVKTEMELSEQLPELSDFELTFWECDQAINRRGVQVDTVAVFNCLNIIEQAHAKYNAELNTLTGGAVTKSSQLAKTQEWLNTLGVSTKSLDKETVEELLKNPLLLPQARRVLEIRRLIGSAAVKKLYAMLNQCAPNGRLHDLFVYHSARTGRAAGVGAQPQNLPAGQEGFDVEKALDVISAGRLDIVEQEYGNATVAVSNCLRGMFIAKPGHALVCSDYSAIEAVVLAELAGEKWRQEVFQTHGKIYETSASKLTGIPFDEILAYKERNGKHHEVRRLGKVAELASGYGGWISAWLNFGAGEFMDEEEIKTAILAWRAASPAIVEFWGGQKRGYEPCLYGVEGAAIQALLYPHAFNAGPVTYHQEDDKLFCTLPSGRRLTYHKPRLAKSVKRPGTYEISYEGWNTNPLNGPTGWVRMLTYSAKLVENVVQAVARDILAHAIVNLEQRGFPIVLHVHDEIVAEVPEGARSLQEFEQIMSTMPTWAAGWPVKAKNGWAGKRYKK